MLHVRNFESADELMAHYRALKSRQVKAPRAVLFPTEQPRKTRTIWDTRRCYETPIGPMRIPAGEVVRDYIKIASTKNTGRDIIRQVAERHGVSEQAAISSLRIKKYAHIRFEIFYRMRSETTLSLPQMGRLVGGRDHTTALHGVQRFAQMLERGEASL